MSDESSAAPVDGNPRKRPYVAPRLEKLGNIRDLTRGQGMSGIRDNVHPPGLNKSMT